MLKYTFFIALVALLTSCGNSSSETNSIESKDKPQVVQVANKINPLGEPCIVTGAEIAKIIGWEEYSEGRPNGINNEYMKACDYGSSSGNLQIGFERYKERIIERKYLEKGYQRELETPADGQTTQEVSAGFGDQAIYVFGRKGPIHTYILKWRFGNHTQKMIYFSSSKKQNAEDKLQQLKQIAAKLEE